MEKDGEASLDMTPPEASLPRWYPHWRGKPWYNGNVEAFAWSLDAIGRAVTFVAVGAFFSVTLLNYAKLAAGCPIEGDDLPECTGRVYGIRPSSLLAVYTIVVGIFSSVALPVMGAVIDYTAHRRLIGQWTSTLFVLSIVPLMFINKDTWFIIANFVVLVALLGWVQTLVTYAYLPELSENQQELNEFTKGFTISSFASMIGCLVVVVGVASAAGFSEDDLLITQFGLGFSLVIGSPTLYFAWFKLLKPRPAAHNLPQGHKLWKEGFLQVYRTSRYIGRNLPALKWFYCSVALVDAGISSLAAISMTYMVDTLNLTSTQTGIAIIALLVGSIPGAYIAGYVNQRWNPIRSTTWATLLVAVNTISAALVLKQAGQAVETYAFALLWGAASGWKWTADRVAASTLIPEGQDAELMGFYLFSGQILTWLPPVVFTVMNENGISQQIGLGSLSIWFILGALCLVMVGDYEQAVESVGRGHMLQDTTTTNQGADTLEEPS